MLDNKVEIIESDKTRVWREKNGLTICENCLENNGVSDRYNYGWRIDFRFNAITPAAFSQFIVSEHPSRQLGRASQAAIEPISFNDTGIFYESNPFSIEALGNPVLSNGGYTPPLKATAPPNRQTNLGIYGRFAYTADNIQPFAIGQSVASAHTALKNILTGTENNSFVFEITQSGRIYRVDSFSHTGFQSQNVAQYEANFLHESTSSNATIPIKIEWKMALSPSNRKSKTIDIFFAYLFPQDVPDDLGKAIIHLPKAWLESKNLQLIELVIDPSASGGCP